MDEATVVSSKQEQPKLSSRSSEPTEDPTSNDSEYDSAGSYSDEEKLGSGGSEDQDSQAHSDFDEQNGVLKRESGDGQESVPSKKVDDDEDKKNPQYIPKRGTFYEHDDRTADDVEAAEGALNEKEDKENKKKIWQDKKEKWAHDRFNDNEQAPKTRAELIQIYGYDIRNEEGPPRARRRRRYGRGPNKYTRNWEDEDAYNKPQPARVKKPPPKKRENAEEFPPLGGNRNKNQDNRKHSESHPQGVWEQNNKSASVKNEVQPQESYSNSNYDHRPVQQSAPREDSPVNQQQEPQSKPQHQRVGTGRVVKPTKEIKDSDYKGFTTKTRQYRNVRTEQKVLPKAQKKDDYIQSQNFTNKNNNVQELEKDLNKMSIQENSFKGGNKHGGNRQGSVPPRLQTEQKGSKRYSSLRQRSLPESVNPPFTQHSNYYPNDYSQQTQQSQPQPQALIQTSPVPPAVPQILPAALPMAPPQVPVTATPILQGPPQFGPAPYPQTAFLQPGVAPPPFIAQQTPQIINYVQGQPPQFPQGFQGFQQQFTPVVSQSLNILENPPTELYQPQGGITYYSADQQVIPRPVPQKRPKAAIPIVAPPSPDENKPSKNEDQTVANEENSEQANYVLEETITAPNEAEEKPAEVVEE